MVNVRVHVGHGIDSECDIEAEFVGVARGGLDPGAGGDTGNDDLGDAILLQILLQIGVGEGAAGSFGHDMIARLPVQFRDQVGPAGGKFARRSGLLGAAGRDAIDIDQHHRQLSRAKRLDQCN